MTYPDHSKSDDFKI